MNTSKRANYLDQQADINHSSNSHIKSSLDTATSVHYGDVNHIFSGANNNNANNNLKRNYSAMERQSSPIKKRPFTQQITSSTQISSAVDNTDDDDDDDDDEGDSLSTNNLGPHTEKQSGSKRDDSQRRAAHTAAEQKRRNAIRKGYDALQSLVPNSQLLDPISSQKVSKAAILKRSTDYLTELNKEQQQLAAQLEAKKKETLCLRVVQKTYEDIFEMNMNSNKKSNATIDDEQKFKVFQSIADELFVSFDHAMESGQLTNFEQFTSAILRWIEDSCRPTDINEIIRRIVGNFKF